VSYTLSTSLSFSLCHHPQAMKIAVFVQTNLTYRGEFVEWDENCDGALDS